jgi:hypothetical protein
MSFIFPLSVAAAKAILKERGITMAKFQETGRLDLSANVRLTVIRKFIFQLVDDSVDGANLVPLLPPEQASKLPACETTEEGTYEDHMAAARAIRERRVVEHALHHD